MSAVKTRIVIVSTDTTYEIPGDHSAATIVQNYSGSISGIANMVSEETSETTTEGVVKILTFKPRTGTKG